jgi:ABC-type multidrug transport system fused ATPase/permease subunit
MTDEIAKIPRRRSQPLRAYRLLVGFAFGTAPREATLFLLCGVVMALFGPVTSLGAKLIVDAALARDLTAAIVAAVLLAAFLGVSLLNTLYYLDFLFAVAEKASAAVNRRLMTLMTGVPGLLHHEHPAYLRELDLLREERGRLAWMTNATAGLLRVIVGLGASLLLLARLDPVLMLLPLLGVVSFLTGRGAQELWIQATEATAEPERLRRHLFDLATTAASGKEVRVFDLVGELIRRHHATAEAVIQTRDRAAWQKAGLEAVGTIAFGLGYVAAIGVTLLRAVDGQVTPGDVVMTIGLAAGLNGVVQIAVSYGTSFLYVLRVAQRYLWLEDYAASTRSRPAKPAQLPKQLVDGIEIQNLSFRYPGMETLILDNVSLRLPAGSVVALVGENGAGKTTLVKILCGFYEPDGGSILVDGVDLPRFPVEAWRARISTAFQDFSRFEFLVRETVGVGQLDRIDDTAAVRLALARGGADDVTASLPHGIETQLGRSWDGGAELSGGQWQKLTLARTMMRPEPLLVVFDEPTASLDAPTEHALFERLAAAARSGQSAGTVTLLVTHRFSTVRMADLIVVLSNGRIGEVGSHSELVNRGGLYSELYELQARTYR